MTHGSGDGRWQRRARFGTAVATVVVAGTALTACDSGGGKRATTTSVAATPATTAPPGVQPLTGDFRITGDRSVSVPAAVGQCRQPANGLPKAFVVTNPALGPNGFVAVYGPTDVVGRVVPPNVKVYVSGTGMLSPASGTGVTVAPDQQSVSFDVNISGGTGNSANGAELPTAFIRAHISGDLRCR